MFNNNSSKGQTTIELLLILTVSVVILAIIYSIYADQFTGNVSSTELFLARSSVQKIVNASNTAYLSGIGSIIKVEVDFPSSVDFDNSKLSSNIISLKLLGGLDVVGIADINFGGSLRKQYGKQVIYLVFDGNKVNLDYLDFELNQYNISFSTLADTNRKETISVRNNSSSNMSFVIENNFSSPGVNIILSKTEFVLAPNAIEYIDFNFIIAKSAIGNYSGNVVFNTMINDVNISKTVSVSTEVLLEMSELMIYPLNTSFTTTANNSVEKSFSVCNKSLNKIEDIAWSSIGESGDGNIINWILNFSDLTNITELNSGECENIVLEFTIPQVSLKKFEASITASYNNSKKIDSEYTTFIFVNVIGTKNYFKQVFDNNLNANYFLSNFVKNTGSSFIPTGELDWNNLARNDTSESKVDNNIIYYGRELDETNFLFNDSNILGVWHL
ncbi:MAG: hypothetical protein PHX27_01950, partial [Candidatus ainarchaeum sp.]|nr:hypothetical protein [Candidatus ainarchaeum sp.]